MLSLPTARCWLARRGNLTPAALPVQARAGTGARGADATLLPGFSSRRALARPQTSHMPHTLDTLRPLRAYRLLRRLPRPRRCGRYAQAHAAWLALGPAPAPESSIKTPPTAGRALATYANYVCQL